MLRGEANLNRLAEPILSEHLTRYSNRLVSVTGTIVEHSEQYFGYGLTACWPGQCRIRRFTEGLIADDDKDLKGMFETVKGQTE